MKAPSDGGARAGMGSNLRYQPVLGQLDVATPDREAVARRLKLEAGVRRFLADFAEHCIASVPASRRANSTTYWLKDMKRPEGKRHQAFVEQVADLIDVGRYSNVSLADAIRAVEVQEQTADEALWLEVNLDEEEAEAALDKAQLLAGPVPPCPTAATRVWEATLQGIRVLCQLRDEAAKYMHVKARAV